MTEITPKELKVINSIGKNNSPSQRDIAKEVGLSLGLTNILVNRLIKKGYVKASRLNAKKVSYIITPQGLKEKARKSYRFMRRSFSVINELKGIIADFAINQYEKGKRRYVILGSGELFEITELVLNSLKLKDITVEKAEESHNIDKNAVIFNTSTRQNGKNAEKLDIWQEAEKLYGSNYEF